MPTNLSTENIERSKAKVANAELAPEAAVLEAPAIRRNFRPRTIDEPSDVSDRARRIYFRGRRPHGSKSVSII